MKHLYNIEELARKKVAEKDFAFDPADWEKAQAGLDAMAAPRRKRRGGMLLWLLGFLMVGSAATAYLWKSEAGMESEVESRKSEVRSRESKVEKSIANSQRLKADQKATAKSQQLTAEKAINSSESDGSQPSKIGSPSQKVQRRKSEDQSGNLKKQTQKNTNLNNTTEFQTNLEISKKVSDLNGENRIISNKIITKNNSINSKTNLSNNHFSGKAIINKIEITEIAHIASMYADKIEIKIIDPEKLKSGNLKRTIQFSLTAGVQSYRAFASEAPQQKQHIDLWGGLSVSYPLTRQFQLKSGLHYFSRTGIGRKVTQTIDRSTFAAEQVQNTLIPTRIHYLQLPIDLQFRLLKRHSLSLGFASSVILTTKNQLTTTNSMTLGQDTESSKKVWGYTKGLRTLDQQIRIGYSYAISPRWEIGGLWSLGLNDVVDNDYFKFNSIDKNNSLRLFLNFKL